MCKCPCVKERECVYVCEDEREQTCTYEDRSDTDNMDGSRERPGSGSDT